jgi:hypothetical protein
LWHFAALRQDDEVIDGFQLVFYCLDKKEEILLDEYHFILGMIENIYQMMEGKPEIHCMQGGAHAGNSKIELQMPVAVEGKARHTIAPFNPQGF